MPVRVPSIARAVGVQLAARALGTLASLGTVAVTTRYLGVAEYGVLTAAIVFVSLWSSLAELGVGATIVRKVGDGSGDLHTLVRVNVGLSLLYGLPLAGVSAAVGVLLVHGGDTELAPVLVIVSVGLALQTLSTCLGPVFAVAVRFGPVALGDVLSRLGSLVATLLVVTAHGGLRWIAAVQLLPPVVLIVVTFLAARTLGPVRPLFDLRAAGRLVRESLPITAVAIVGVLYWRADGLILTLLSDAPQVAAYGLGYTIAFNLAVVSTFYLNSSLSTMTAAFARDRGEFAALIRRGLELMLFMGAPVVAFGVPLAGPVVELLGSREFVEVTRVPLMLLLVAVVLTFGTGLVGQALFAAHEQRFLLWLNIVNLIVNIGLNIALAHAFGAVGVGIALLVSETSGLLVCLWKLRRVCGLHVPVGGPVRLLLPVGVGVGVLVALHHLPVVVPLAAALAAYLLVNAVVGPVTLPVLRGLFARGGSDPADRDRTEPVAP